MQGKLGADMAQLATPNPSAPDSAQSPPGATWPGREVLRGGAGGAGSGFVKWSVPGRGGSGTKRPAQWAGKLKTQTCEVSYPQSNTKKRPLGQTASSGRKSLRHCLRTCIDHGFYCASETIQCQCGIDIPMLHCAKPASLCI